MIERLYQDRILDDLLLSKKFSNVIIIEGARQVGKTTLITELLSKLSGKRKIIRFNLEVEKTVRANIDECSSFAEFNAFLEKNYNFDSSSNQILFIDEAQESRQLGAFVRSMKEEWEQVKVVLTGSSMSRLFHKDVRFPVGRINRYKISPFNFYEFLLANGKDGLAKDISNWQYGEEIFPLIHKEFLLQLDKYLLTGGLPMVVRTFAEQGDYRELRKSIYLDQEEDFVRKMILQKNYLFGDAFKGVANNLGFPSKYTHIAEKTNDAKEILSLLKKWHLILDVEQHGLNSTTLFYPKRYVYDLGIAQDRRKMPFPDLSTLETTNQVLRTQLGGILENYLFLSLDNYKLWNYDLTSWRKNSNEQVEVDFVWRVDNMLLPIECKSTMRVTNRNFSSVRSFLDESGLKLGFLASCAPFQVFKINGQTLINLPLYLCTPEIIIKLAKEFY